MVGYYWHNDTAETETSRGDHMNEIKESHWLFLATFLVKVLVRHSPAHIGPTKAEWQEIQTTFSSHFEGKFFHLHSLEALTLVPQIAGLSSI